MNRTTKINILAYASEPDKNYEYDGDYAYLVFTISITNGLKTERRK